MTIGDGGRRRIKARALLDPCSEATLIKEGLMRKLGTPLERNYLCISGVAGVPMDSARVKTKIFLHPAGRRDPIQAEVYGLRHIGIVTPACTLGDITNELGGLTLADPGLAKPAGIDIILGTNIYSQLIRPRVEKRGSLLAQETIFGWVVTGVVVEGEDETATSMALTIAATEVEPSLLQKFWSIEEIPRKPRISEDDLNCEELYATQYSRDQHGRYIVPLPVKNDTVRLLGSNLPASRFALSAQQRRMQRDAQLKHEYNRFMNEYLEMGHMRRLMPHELEDDSTGVHYIPHHGIWQRSDDGAKL